MKKIPTWAVYLADVICVVSALIIAITYCIAGLPMGASVAMLCAVMIIAAAAMICTAQIFHFKYTKLSKAKSETKLSANIEENFQILFKQVSAIKRDNATLNANFTSLLDRYNELSSSLNNNDVNEKILSNFKALNTKVEELENRFAKEEDITSLKLEVEESIENLKADVELDLGKLDDIDNAVKELKAIIEDIGDSVEVEAIEEDLEAQDDLDEIIDAPVEIEEEFEEEIEESPVLESASVKFLREAQEKLKEAQAKIKESEELDEEHDDLDDLDLEDLDENDGVDPSDDLSQIGLMSRALNNTQQSQSILGSFARIEKVSKESPKEDELEDGNDFVDIEDDLSDLDEDLANIMKLGTKEEASIIINAMLGLGNKPYIRGNAPELSESTGIQMEFMEIGKWRYIFKDLREDAKVSIWLNDEEISKEGVFTISENEQLEINVNFS